MEGEMDVFSSFFEYEHLVVVPLSTRDRALRCSLICFLLLLIFVLLRPSYYRLRSLVRRGNDSFKSLR